jgi:hypothetical protein
VAAARVLLSQMGISPADLVTAGAMAPTFAEVNRPDFLAASFFVMDVGPCPSVIRSSSVSVRLNEAVADLFTPSRRAGQRGQAGHPDGGSRPDSPQLCWVMPRMAR